jgi:hypothetical protein
MIVLWIGPFVRFADLSWRNQALAQACAFDSPFCGMMIAIITPTFQEELSDFKWNYNSVKSVVQDATPKRSF